MQSFDFKKQVLPHLLIILGFALLVIFYCYPAIEGKELYQHDNVSWKAMSQEAKEYHERTGENVMWSNSMFGGMPTYTYYLAETNNFILKIQDVIVNALPKPAYFLFIALVCFYILMNVLKVNRWLGIIAAFAFTFAAYNMQIIAAGHDTKMLALAYMPAVLAGLLMIYRKQWLSGAALTGVSLALMIANGHWQVDYYLMIMILCMVISLFVQAIKEGKIKDFIISSLIALVVAVVAVAPSMPGLLTTREYSKETMRGGQSELTEGHDKGKKSGGLDKDYAFVWSSGLGETFCLMIPDLYGGSSEPIGPESKTYEEVIELGYPDQAATQVSQSASKYWGPQRFLSGPVYFGAVICFLFVLSLFVMKSKHKWWILAVSILAIMMSWGDHFAAFNYFLFDNLPMLNKFRTPTMMLILPQMLFPLAGALALNDIIKERIDKDELWKKTRVAVLITAGLCLLLTVGGSLFFDYKSQYVNNPATGETRDDALKTQLSQAFQDPAKAGRIMKAVQEDRAAMALNSGLLSAFYIVLAGGLLWAYSRKKIKGQHLVIALGILVAVDLLPQARKYLNDENYMEESDYEALFAPRPVDQQIKQDQGYYRVLDLTTDVYNDAMPAYHHKLIGGYSPAKLEIYQDLIDRQLGGRGFNAQVLNMLNTKYIVVPGQNNQPTAQVNRDALGNAWFVNEIKWVNSADEEMSSLNAVRLGDTVQKAGDFEPLKTAVVRNTFKEQINGYAFGKDSAAYVKLAKYGLNEISFTSSNSQNGFAVFSDIYYPRDWKAFVDGKETPIVRANYVLRAIKIPAGQHKIEFKFESETFKKGNNIALIGSLLIYALLIAGIVAAFRNNKEASERPTNE